MSTTRNLLIAALLASSNAMAASSIDLTVKGSITPSACTPSIPNDGVVDYGKLSAKELNVDKVTRLEPVYLGLRVVCDASTLYALQGSDNRAGSEPTGHEGNFGLGLINSDEKLGSFFVSFDKAMADDVPARFINSYDGGATWNPWPGGGLWVGGTVAVANNTVIAPIPVKVMTTEMDIRTLIAPTNTLTLTEEVPIDGSVTVTVIYL